MMNEYENDGEKYLKKFVDSLQFFGKAFTCPICLSLLKNAYTTACLHSFCEDCLRKWMKSKPNCPLCKQQIKRREIGPYDKMARLVNIFRDLHPKDNDDSSDFEPLSQCAPESQLMRSFGGTNIDPEISSHLPQPTNRIPAPIPVLEDDDNESHKSEDLIIRNTNNVSPIPEIEDEGTESNENENVSMNNVNELNENEDFENTTIENKSIENKIENDDNIEIKDHQNSKEEILQSETITSSKSKQYNQENIEENHGDELPFADINPGTAFVVGNTVTVEPQMGPGMNKPGGAGRIEGVNKDGTYYVRFTIGRSVDKSVPAHLIRPGSSIVEGKRRSTRTHRADEYEKTREIKRKRKSQVIENSNKTPKRPKMRSLSLSGTQERNAIDALWDMAAISNSS